MGGWSSELWRNENFSANITSSLIDVTFTVCIKRISVSMCAAYVELFCLSFHCFTIHSFHLFCFVNIILSSFIFDHPNFPHLVFYQCQRHPHHDLHHQKYQKVHQNGHYVRVLWFTWKVIPNWVRPEHKVQHPTHRITRPISITLAMPHRFSAKVFDQINRQMLAATERLLLI